MNNSARNVGLGCAGMAGLILVALFVLGSVGPDTTVYTGQQLPKRYLKTINSLDLLEEDERIKYFYSDALVDITDGFYFVTKQHLVLYCGEWEEPKAIIDMNAIVAVDAEFSDSFLEDSTIYITTTDELDYWFPLSNERHLAERFVDFIKSNMAAPSE